MDRTIKQALVWGLVVFAVVTLLWAFRYQVSWYLVQDPFSSIATTQQQTQQRLTAEREQVRSERLAAESAERARLEAQQRAEESRRRREREFEQAFLASYAAPQGCDNWQSDRHMVECVNHKMRAKRTFRTEFFPETQDRPL